MTHPIEEKINDFLNAVCSGNASISEELIEEFGERCKNILRDNFVEKKTAERTFSLRMSNIGRPLRQLLLDKAASAKGLSSKPSKEWKLRSTVGHVYEAFMLTLLKAAEVGLEEQDKQVSLDVSKTTIQGTLDIIINKKVYDIKTASQYAYEHKFVSTTALSSNDTFGYFAQGFGYAEADKKDFGGWIVINKNTGDFKVLEIPESSHEELKAKYLDEITYKVKHIEANMPMPPCKGVVQETFKKKPTGNRILNKECEYCEYKFMCHPSLQGLPEVFSTAKERRMKFYVGPVTYPKKVFAPRIPKG